MYCSHVDIHVCRFVPGVSPPSLLFGIGGPSFRRGVALGIFTTAHRCAARRSEAKNSQTGTVGEAYEATADEGAMGRLE